MPDSWSRHRTGVVVIGITWLAFFSRTLLGQDVYFLDDLKIIYYPLEHAYAWFQSQGRLPLWSPHFGFGQPLLAWGQLGFFTPLHVLLRGLGLHPLTLLQVSIVSYFAVGLGGMYAWLSRLKLSAWPASLGALVFAFSGFAVGHLNHVNFYTSTMLLPGLLLALTVWLEQPTRRRTAVLALTGAAIALSGQPQVVLYTFIMAALYGLIGLTLRPPAAAGKSWPRYLTPRLIHGLVAAVVAVCLASLAILPLAEFLPLTERNDALTEADLLDFSYPPYHAITLLFPYFFGDHATYWGPKGFQELAAYVGIIPLLLAGAALGSWRTYRRERLFAVLLLLIALLFASGRYSPLYTYLVTEKILTSLSIPGRFVFFFDVAIAVLASVGLHDLRRSAASRRERLGSAAGAALFTAALFVPFAWQLQHDARLLTRFLALPQVRPLTGLLVSAGTLAVIIALGTRSRPRLRYVTAPALVALSALTLVSYGWHYNPLTPPPVAYALSPFADTLRSFTTPDGLSARLYASQQPIVTKAADQPFKLTDALAPDFTVHQVIRVQNDRLDCVQVPIYVDDRAGGRLQLSIRPAFSDPPLREAAYPAATLETNRGQHLCFDSLTGYAGQALIFSFASQEPSNIHLLYEQHAVSDEPAYFVRVINPTPDQLNASQKPLRLVLNQEYALPFDREAVLLARHIQSVTGSSSARWIGALSIRPYREFIEFFFANDRDEVFDGDGRHAVMNSRRLFDMAGVTHLSQEVRPDTSAMMAERGFTPVAESNNGGTTVGLYHNPAAYPKAFIVRNAAFLAAADDTRAAMLNPAFDPRQLVYVTGPTPPENLPPADDAPLSAAANITLYDPTRVDVVVDTPTDAWLVLTDTATPQWQTFIDDQPAAQYVANSLFRAAHVPAGQHTVSFRYHSPAAARAMKLTLVGLVATGILLLWPASWQPFRRIGIIKNNPLE